MEHKSALAAYLADYITARRRGLFEQVLAGRTRRVRLLIDGVHNTGDVCAVMRSCECYGIQDLDLVGVPAFQARKGIAVGASKWVSFQHVAGAAAQARLHYATLKQRGYRVVTLDPSRAGATPIHQLDLSRKTVLVLSGAAGPSATTHAASDGYALVPTAGFTHSFNISVTAALCLSSISSRLRAGTVPWQLSEEERLDLSLEWLAKMPKRIKELVAGFCETRGLDPAQLAAALPEPARALMF